MERVLIHLNDLIEYRILVTCRGCRSIVQVDISSLIAKVGGRATLQDVFRRFRCGKCHGRARLMEVEHWDAGKPFSGNYAAKPVLVIDEHGVRPRAAKVDRSLQQDRAIPSAKSD